MYWNFEVIINGLFAFSKLGLSYSKIIGVYKYSKLVEEPESEKGSLLGISEWGDKGNTEGNMLGTNIRNDE